MQTAPFDSLIHSLLSPLPQEDQESFHLLQHHERTSWLAQKLSIPTTELVQSLSSIFNLPFIQDFSILPSFKDILPIRLMQQFSLLPFLIDPDGVVHCVTSYPLSPIQSQWLQATLESPTSISLTTPEILDSKITDLFGVGFFSLEGADISELEQNLQFEESIDENAAIIKFVNEIILKAIEDRATDIHFEPQRNSLQIRYRIDGELIPIQLPDHLIRLQAAIISRLKIMSRLNISEKRRPQDGRIKFNAKNANLDIRVSTLPTAFGESVSLRLLNQGSQPLTLTELGLLPEDESKVAPIIHKPHGIILVTGPTGSGKSTTLGAFIRAIRAPEIRIITVEDPIENEIPGVNQTQIQPEVGLTFANALRHILRQDPDVIMLGEIRDRETAEIAIRASLTGHLVFSTLHTNDSAGALTRLIDMEIEPFLLASSVEMVVAQRLVRRLCPHCAIPATFEPGELEASLEALGVPLSEASNAHLLKQPNGCEKCRNLGFRGRIGIFEILLISEEIHSLVVQRKPARLIRDLAIQQGMRTLQQCAWEQVKLGHTSLQTVMRYAELLNE